MLEIKPNEGRYTMQIEIKEAIKLLAKKITEDVKSGEALQFTQAALNLAHTAQVIKQEEQK